MIETDASKPAARFRLLGDRGPRALAAAASLVVVLVSALVPAACGSDEDSESSGGGSRDRLIAPLGSELTIAGYIDLDLTREQLGLESDADPLDIRDLALGTAQGDLVQQASSAIGPLAESVARLQPQPSLSVIDGGAISAAASTIGPGDQVTVLATSQPFEEISAALAEIGFEPGEGEVGEGAMVAGPEAEPDSVEAVAELPGGLVALYGDAESIDLDPPAEVSGPASSLLSELGGSVTLAGNVSQGSCIAAFAIDQQEADGGGEIVLALTDQPNPGAAEQLEPLEFGGATVTFAAPEVTDDRVRTTFTVSGDDGPTAPVASQLFRLFTPLDVYSC